MTLNFTIKGQIMIKMHDYVKKILNKCPYEELCGKIKTPWNEELFKVKEESPNYQ